MFPVAWTTIYLLIAWVGYRLTLLPGNETALALWSAQIALNTLWTPAFFGANRIVAGMIILALLWLVVAAMLWLALRLDVITGLILSVPSLVDRRDGAELFDHATKSMIRPPAPSMTATEPNLQCGSGVKGAAD